MIMEDKATTQTQIRYHRIAPAYDLMEVIVERTAFSRWRTRLWSQVEGERILEVGVGTGKNIPYYPTGIRVTAVDLSDKMMQRAQRRAGRLTAEIDLSLVDAQRLAFADATFDAPLATFVFCSGPDAVLGLRELARMVKPGGRIILLEHVRVDKPVIGDIMDLLDPIVVRLMGPHINRTTVENVRNTGLEIKQVVELAPEGLVKLIVAWTEQE